MKEMEKKEERGWVEGRHLEWGDGGQETGKWQGKEIETRQERKETETQEMRDQDG